jgi:hypothetical protein
MKTVSNMIDLTRIRSIKSLEEMKKDIIEFINNPLMLEIYREDVSLGEDAYADDKEQAEQLLVKIEKRSVSLTKFNQREAKQKSQTKKLSD